MIGTRASVGDLLEASVAGSWITVIAAGGDSVVFYSGFRSGEIGVTVLADVTLKKKESIAKSVGRTRVCTHGLTYRPRQHSTR